MDVQAIYERLRQQFGEQVAELNATVKTPFIRVEKEALLAVMGFLRDAPEMRFDCLQLLTGVDYPDRISCVYHLTSYALLHSVAIKVDLPRENPEIDSVVALWPAADWHEREEYDMLGIVFKGHPHLHRIMCPEDWEGFPLRKDYVQPEEYHGISNTRQIGDRAYPDREEAFKAVQQYKPPKAAPAAPAPKPAAAEETSPKREPTPAV